MSEIDYTPETILENLRDMEQLATAGLTAVSHGLPSAAPMFFERLACGIEETCLLVRMQLEESQRLRSNEGTHGFKQQ